MKKTNKKAFTIVELVIVIAVIAILAAVLIPTFSSIIKKANVSSDTQIIRNANTALATDLKEHATMTEALKAAESYGLNISKINAKATDNEILWDSANDVFCYYNGETKSIEYIPETTTSKTADECDYWEIVDITSETPKATVSDKKWSLYARSTTVGTITVTSGFDAGDCTFTSIAYNGVESAQDVVIRSNGGSLVVDAAKDSVQHYGELTFLNIKAVATSSYHEFGYTAQGQINSGRVVIEDTKVEKSDGSIVDAAIDGLFLVAKTEEATTATGSFDTIIIETKGDADMPTLDRSEVTINETTGTKVCEVKTPSEDNDIWLTKNGIYENVTVTTPGATTAGTTAPTENTDTAQAGWEIANAAKRNDQGQLIDSEGNVTTDTTKAVVEEKASQEDLNKGTTLFAGGAGTKTNPYLISNNDQFKNIAKFNYINNEYHFKLISDITFQDSSLCQYFSGSIDGNGHSLLIGTPDETTTQYIFSKGSLNDITIKNLNIYEDTNLGTIFYSINQYTRYYGNIVFDNITVNNKKGNNLSSLLGDGRNNDSVFACFVRGNISFNNITNNMNMDTCSYYGGFFYGYSFDDGSTISYIKCVNNGNLSGTNVGFFTGSPNQGSGKIVLCQKSDFSDSDAKTRVYMKDCVNNGIIRGTLGAGLFAVSNTVDSSHFPTIVALNKSIVDQGKVILGGASLISDGGVNINLSLSDGKVSIDNAVSNADTYNIILRASYSDKTGSSYLYIIYNINVGDKIDYVSKVYSEYDYEQITGVKYNNINATEKNDNYGNLYKQFVSQGENIIVFTSPYENARRGGGKPEYYAIAKDNNGTTIASGILDNNN